MRNVTPWLAACLGCVAPSALAHAGHVHADALAWNWWQPPVVLMFACSVLYALGWRRCRRQGAGRALGAWRPACFAAGIGALAAALASPLDAMAERSFTAHMLQHLLLMLVAPPLLVWSRPVYAMLWAFRPATRRRIGQWWTHRSRLRGVYDGCMRPFTAWLLASVALWLWHVPALYDLALRNETVHVTEHLCFFLTSLSFWTLVERPWQRHAGYGTAIVMLAAFALHNGLLGAVLSFSSVPLYLAYAGGADTTATVADQQLAGLLMWIPAGVVHLAAFAALFPGWLNGIGHRGRQGRVPPAKLGESIP